MRPQAQRRAIRSGSDARHPLDSGNEKAVSLETANGAPSGTRTRDTLIKSQVLYQLS